MPQSAEQIRKDAAFVALAETVSSLIALIQGDKVVYANPAAARMLGYSIVGRDFWDVVHPEDREAARTRGRTRQSGVEVPKRLVERLLHADGRAVWMDYSTDLVVMGGIPTVLVTGHDITDRLKTEDDLRRSEERYRAAFEDATVGKMIASVQLRVPIDQLAQMPFGLELRAVQVNRAFCSMIGYSKDEILAMPMPITTISHPDDVLEGLDAVIGLLEGRTAAARVQKRYLHKDGHVVWGRLTVTCSRDAEGRPLFLTSEIEDITERRRAEEALKASESRFRTAFTNASIGKVILAIQLKASTDHIRGAHDLSSVEMRIVQVNPAFGRMVGYTEQEILTMPMPVQTISHPDDLLKGREEILRLMEGSTNSAQTEKRLIHRSGRVVWARFTTTLTRDAAGRPLHLVHEIEDVTERKAAEDALRASEQRFRLAFDNAAIGKAVVAPDGRFLQVNKALCSMLGRTEAEMLASDVWRITHPDDIEATHENVKEMLDGAHVVSTRKRVLHKDGRVLWMDITNTIIRNADGTPAYGLAELLDVTERKLAEDALRQSEERFRGLFRESPVMMSTVDAENRISDVNNAWLATFGYAREEVIGRNGLDMLTPASRARLEGAEPGRPGPWVAQLQNQPLQCVRKDGSLLDVLVTTVPDLDEHGRTRGLICVSIDVTALRETEARFRSMIEYAPEAIIVADAETTKFVEVNAVAERMFDMSREQMLGIGPVDCSPPRQPDGRSSAEAAAEKIRRAVAGENVVFEWIHLSAGGREIPCRIHLSPFPSAGRTLVRATIADISTEKRLQEQVRHQEKMAAMGILAAGVAHEIGNPLAALSMAVQSLEKKVPDEYAQKKIGFLKDHIERISRIVRQMSDLARPQSRRKAKVDINAVVRRALDVVRYDKRAKDVEIVRDFADMDPHVEAVEDEIMQVCINLSLNALDAMAANGPDRPRRLTVSTRCESCDTRPSFRIAFEDTGTGIPLEIRDRLFQPFFTTKEAGKGTGLGLSISYKILQEHGGALRLDDRPGPGARFVLEIPVK